MKNAGFLGKYIQKKPLLEKLHLHEFWVLFCIMLFPASLSKSLAVNRDLCLDVWL